MHYQLFHNQTASFCRSYEPGDVLVEGYRGEFPACFEPRTDVPVDDMMFRLAEVVYMKHNRDDRPDGKTAPSLSVGDVVVIGEVALSVASVGFEVVTMPPSVPEIDDALGWVQDAP